MIHPNKNNQKTPGDRSLMNLIDGFDSKPRRRKQQLSMLSSDAEKPEAPENYETVDVVHNHPDIPNPTAEKKVAKMKINLFEEELDSTPKAIANPNRMSGMNESGLRIMANMPRMSPNPLKMVPQHSGPQKPKQQ